jgi:hypothetical protein
MGRQLHRHAIQLARLALSLDPGHLSVAAAAHLEPIHPKAVVEAFPNMFLGSLIPEASLPALHRDATDRYWEVLVANRGLDALVETLLPARIVAPPFARFTDHDERAAIASALTALCVAAGAYVGVGDAVGGDIFLPPEGLWGSRSRGAGSWVEAALDASALKVRRAFASARVTRPTGRWK